jgi:hypothetical protein
MLFPKQLKWIPAMKSLEQLLTRTRKYMMHRIQHENMDTVARNSKFRGAYSTKCDGGMHMISIGDDFLSWCPFARKYKHINSLSSQYITMLGTNFGAMLLYKTTQHANLVDVTQMTYSGSL